MTTPATTPPRLVLASASPARLATLRAAGVEPEVVVSGVDESTVSAASVAALAGRLAVLKAEAVAATLPPSGDGPVLVLGCDSMLELDGEPLGKPGTAAEATRRWRAMRGRSGVLHTGHHVLVLGDPARTSSAVGSTTVHFADLTDAEVDAYVGTGEPLQVAGAFTVDGLGGPFVRAVEGDHHNVVGLSLPLLREMLAGLGVAWTDLWR
ncbi:septum formation protein [Friedmanniella luteola]|uniref:Nucleoside triphosphate pyrophosphatase n=1 Tax=Friedmanniella luteola TaxID=546871 RepID=A0A1H1YJT2_9ACTN|nr:Maf family protein [Friedmanniella luteola]SDT21672.1 septum formation protein [Friedmanniella luteola]